MKIIFVTLGVLFVLVVGAVIWLHASPPPSAGGPVPTIGTTIALPALIAVNTPTIVTVTSVIDTPTLNPTTVDLLRLNPDGTTTVIGELNDKGKNGDKKPGDKTFTAQMTFNEPTTGEIRLQVSAAFRGLLRRTLSAPITVDVWNSYVDTVQGYSLLYDPLLQMQQPTTGKTVFDERAVAVADGDSPAAIEIFAVPTTLNDELQYTRSIIVDAYSETAIRVGGEIATKITGVLGSNVFGRGNQSRSFVLFSHGKTTFKFEYDVDDPHISNIVSSMLATFTFAD
jgi:hypothetical protein